MTLPEDSNATDRADEVTPETFWSERNVRILKLTVIVMSVLIVLGLMVLFATIVNRVISGKPEDTTPTISVPVPDDVSQLLDADAEIVSTAIDGSRMAIVVKRPEGHTVIVVDLRTGKVLNVIGRDAGR